jgi:hypothetical protein
MNGSEIKEIHEEKYFPHQRAADRESFFRFRDGIEIHAVCEAPGDNRKYFVFDTDWIRRNSKLSTEYRVGRLDTESGKILVMGYGSIATKFREVPTAEEITEAEEIMKDNGHRGWLPGNKIYG